MKSAVGPMLLCGVLACASDPERGDEPVPAVFVDAYRARIAAAGPTPSPGRALDDPDEGAVESDAAAAGRPGARPPSDRADEWRGEVLGVIASPEDFPAARADAHDEAQVATLVGEPLSLEAYLRLLWLRDPGLEAHRRELEATRAQLDQAARLGELSREYRTYTRELRLRTGAGDHDESAATARPWPDVSALRGAWLEADVELGRQRVRAAVSEALAAGMEAAAEWRFTLRHEEVVAAQLEVYARLEPVVEHQVAGGAGTLADLIAVKAARASLDEKLAELGDRRSELRRRIHSLLALPPSAGLATPAMAPWSRAVVEPDSVTIWTERARRQRAELAERRAELRRVTSARRLAELTVTPPPSSGAALLHGGATGEAGVSRDASAFRERRGLSPWWGTREAAIDGLREREAAASSRLDDLERRLASEVERALVLARDARRDEALFRDELLGLSEDALDAARSAYEGGRARFPDVLEAARRQWDVQLGLARAGRDRLRAEAALLRASGVSPRHAVDLERRP